MLQHTVKKTLNILKKVLWFPKKIKQYNTDNSKNISS